MKRWRVAYFLSHPIQYQAPLLRYLAQQPELELTTFYLSDFSVRAYHDPGFGAQVAWDVPLLDGHAHEFLPMLGPAAPLSALRPFNTGVARALRRGFDALWVHGYAHLTLLRAIRIARALRLPVLLRGESHLDSHPRGATKRAFKRLLLPRLFARVDAFLSIGRRNADYYRHYGVSEGRIFAMPYAVDNVFFRGRADAAATRRETLRASLDLAPERPVILYASKFQARKRPQDLLEAYCRVSGDGRAEPRPYLLLAGDGELRAQLEARARATGWSSIRFLGFRNQQELPALYDLCDVFVLPSEHEPWGLIVNEVMNAARAVIVSDAVGCASDLIEPGVSGETYPVGDVAALAERLRHLCEDAPLRARLGRAAQEKVAGYGFDADWQGLRAALQYVSAR